MPIAIADREAIFLRIAPDDLGAALKLDERFEEHARMLGKHPEAGRVGRVPGTREYVSHPHYILVYEIGVDALRILNVLHTSLQWPSPQKRARRKRRRGARPARH